MKSYVKDFNTGQEISTVKLKPLKPIKGLVTVELFDAMTRRKTLEAKTENIVTADGYRVLREMMINGMIASGDIARISVTNLFNEIQLYTGAEPEADDPYPVFGALVGWSNKSTYSSTDTQRGAINLSETNISMEDYTRIHLVFDWPTHAANGTFQTIVFGYQHPLNFRYTSYTSPVSSPRGMAWDGANLWVVSSDKVYKLNPDTLEIVSSITSPISSTWGVAWDGVNLWVSGYNSPLYKINPSTGAVISTIPSPDNRASLTWDGESLWVAGGNTSKIYKVSPSNGNVILSFNAPVTADEFGIAWDGQGLWLSSFGSYFYYCDTSGQILNTVVAPESRIYGLGWDGNNLWAAENYYNILYKIYNVRYGARTLLASPVTKTNTNTMKIQYDFVFQE